MSGAGLRTLLTGWKHIRHKNFLGIVYFRCLCMNILLLIEEFQIKEKTICRLSFLTDTDQFAIEVFGIYHTPVFQIEIGFRDAKKFVGLENLQTID